MCHRKAFCSLIDCDAFHSTWRIQLQRIVIAEIGINHDGEMVKARELINIASRSGCNGIKFQYRNPKNSYSNEIKEIGDEILQNEIEKTFLSSENILELATFAQKLDLLAGISFFSTEDLADFPTRQRSFDFFKIPSAEFMNFPLECELLVTGKPVYLSLGMHTESEVEEVFNKLRDYDNWVPMHCVSNYPVANHNSALGYIKHLIRKWNRPVGFSSHDEFWENCLIALGFGATVFERHITLNPLGSGLDHSSSSTFSEFTRLCRIVNDYDLISLGDGPRVPNQGEMLNKQNLGRSFYAKTSLDVATPLRYEDFSYRSPMTGLGISAFGKAVGSRLTSQLQEGEALSRKHLEDQQIKLSETEFSRMRELNVSLPVRLNDYNSVRKELPIGGFEFHLSFREVASDLSQFEVHSEDALSVHLPDYISSKSLINPLSNDAETRIASLSCIQRVADFANQLSSATGRPVPIVASLSVPSMPREEFYGGVLSLFEKFSTPNCIFTLQWLPPIAWYFGGSVRLEMMNEYKDVDYLRRSKLPITMDTSHLILGRNAFGFDPIEIMDSLKDQIAHIHLSDAIGIDGEGLQFGDGGMQNDGIFDFALAMKPLKVLEVWQGHLDGFQGFKEAIRRLASRKYLAR